MLRLVFGSFLVLLHHASSAVDDNRPELTSQIKQEWHMMDYDWPHVHFRDTYIEVGKFVPEKTQISGLAVHDGRVYLTVPRVLSSTGIPWVLTRLSTSSNRKYNLDPWPDYTGQDAGKCDDLQNPLAIDVDHNTNRLYVLDNGRVGISTPHPKNDCPAKIVVFSTRNGRNDTFLLADNVVSKDSSVLTAIVLDYISHTENEVRYAYMADAGTNKLIVYDFINNRTWSFQDPRMGEMDQPDLVINGERFSVKYGFNNLALSPDFNYLYFSSTGSHKLYQVPTWVLRDPSKNFTAQVRLVGNKGSNADSMIHGKDALYFTAVEQNAVYRWETRQDMMTQQVFENELTIETLTPVAQNWETMQWPDAVALDDRGNLWFTTNKAHLFYSGMINFSDPDAINFRLFKEPVDDYSYLDNSMPKDPIVIG